MSYPVLVLLPFDATWPQVDDVQVVDQRAADASTPHATTDITQELELRVHATDDALASALDRVGQLAASLGGTALDGRSMRRLVAVPRPPRADADPGPVWEHLPGVGLTAAPSFAITDPAPALAQLEDALDVHAERTEHEEPVGPPILPGGFGILARAWRDGRENFGEILAICIVLGALASVDPIGRSSVGLVLLTWAGILAVPIALVTRPFRRPATLWFACGTAVAQLLPAVIPAPPPVDLVVGLGSVVILVLAIATWVGDDPRRAIRATGIILRTRFPSLFGAWIVAGFIAAVPTALVALALAHGRSLDDTNLAPAAVLLVVLETIYAVAIAATAVEWLDDEPD